MKYTFVHFRRDISSFGRLPWTGRIYVWLFRQDNVRRIWGEIDKNISAAVAQLDAINDVLSPAERNDPLSLVDADRIIEIAEQTGIARRDVELAFRAFQWCAKSAPQRARLKRQELLIDLGFPCIGLVLIGLLVVLVLLSLGLL